MIKAARPELSLIEFEVKPGGGVQPHYHRRHSDSFYVLEGELEVHVGDEVVNAVPGMYVLAPPEVVHFFRNVSAAPVRVLNLHTPGGFAEYRLELEALYEKASSPIGRSSNVTTSSIRTDRSRSPRSSGLTTVIR